MTLVTLVTGFSASAREAAIAALLDDFSSTALILEGMPDGDARFDRFGSAADIQIKRIAPGCVCCIGNLTLRVTLNRILRHPPARLYLSLATATHLDEIKQFLIQAPYDALLELTDDLCA
ncbi:MAG: GTPase [Burkholderiales bacterium RIFCSPLOWO2_02_FULL_57_36]|nr:MAG: GTPase [Burkholderiales bacterium RIFCSPLOWO2_02_FULL_57_36]